MSEENASGDATSQKPDPASGAMPAGKSDPDGATPQGDGKGATPDTLSEAGRITLDKEREARREAERSVAQLRERLQQLEDAGKSGLELAQSQLRRAQAELEKVNGRVRELEGELSKRDLDALKRQVAEEHELPAGVWKRLQGADLRELRADARSLKEEIGARPGDLGANRGGTASGNRRGTDMNALIREAAGR